MRKEELIALVKDYGDATITYRSQNSRKLKYNVCTLDFTTPCITTKQNRAKETPDTVLFFCWDTFSYRLLRPASVISVIPLAAVLKNENA